MPPDVGLVGMVSAIIPVGERQSPVGDLYSEYKTGLEALGVPFEMIFVLDGPQPSFESALTTLISRGEPITIVTLTRYFGEATAIMIGFEHASGNTILTLPAYLQVEGREIGKLVAALADSDVAVGHREPRATNWFQSLRRGAFHGLLKLVTRLDFHDLGCSARALSRRVLEEIQLYGEQQRFLPILAERQGFRVSEIAIRQSCSDRRDGMYRPRNYTRGFLDIFTIFFLVRFTKKPLRFFGMIGVAVFAVGMLQLLYLLFDRIYFRSPLADRPALLLASLLIVLGVQIFALGLLGELIIFTHAGSSKDYKVDRVIHYTAASAGTPESSDAAPGRIAGRETAANSSHSTSKLINQAH
jgi:glycosyltransferase involved in cell wall biosynthesis